jgi:hypothetical protein
LWIRNMPARQGTRQAHERLETRQAQSWKRVRLRTGNVSGSYQMVKEVSYHHGSKSSSLLGLSEVILWPGSLAALQGTRQAHLKLETRQAHVRLEMHQAHSIQNAKGDVIPPMQQIW